MAKGHDGWENVKTILLMEEILHQLRLVVYPISCRVLHIPGGAGFLPSTACPDSKSVIVDTDFHQMNLKIGMCEQQLTEFRIHQSGRLDPFCWCIMTLWPKAKS